MAGGGAASTQMKQDVAQQHQHKHNNNNNNNNKELSSDVRFTEVQDREGTKSKAEAKELVAATLIVGIVLLSLSLAYTTRQIYKKAKLAAATLNSYRERAARFACLARGRVYTAASVLQLHAEVATVLETTVLDSVCPSKPNSPPSPGVTQNHCDSSAAVLGPSRRSTKSVFNQVISTAPDGMKAALTALRDELLDQSRATAQRLKVLEETSLSAALAYTPAQCTPVDCEELKSLFTQMAARSQELFDQAKEDYDECTTRAAEDRRMPFASQCDAIQRDLHTSADALRMDTKPNVGRLAAIAGTLAPDLVHVERTPSTVTAPSSNALVSQAMSTIQFMAVVDFKGQVSTDHVFFGSFDTGVGLNYLVGYSIAMGFALIKYASDWAIDRWHRNKALDDRYKLCKEVRRLAEALQHVRDVFMAYNSLVRGMFTVHKSDPGSSSSSSSSDPSSSSSSTTTKTSSSWYHGRRTRVAHKLILLGYHGQALPRTTSVKLRNNVRRLVSLLKDPAMPADNVQLVLSSRDNRHLLEAVLELLEHKSAALYEDNLNMLHSMQCHQLNVVQSCVFSSAVRQTQVSEGLVAAVSSQPPRACFLPHVVYASLFVASMWDSGIMTSGSHAFRVPGIHPSKGKGDWYAACKVLAKEYMHQYGGDDAKVTEIERSRMSKDCKAFARKLTVAVYSSELELAKRRYYRDVNSIKFDIKSKIARDGNQYAAIAAITSQYLSSNQQPGAWQAGWRQATAVEDAGHCVGVDQFRMTIQEWMAQVPFSAQQWWFNVVDVLHNGVDYNRLRGLKVDAAVDAYHTLPKWTDNV